MGPLATVTAAPWIPTHLGRHIELDTQAPAVTEAFRLRASGATVATVRDQERVRRERKAAKTMTPRSQLPFVDAP